MVCMSASPPPPAPSSSWENKWCEQIDLRRLILYGPLVRLTDTTPVQLASEDSARLYKQPTDKPKLTWHQLVTNNLKNRGLSTEAAKSLAQDKKAWWSLAMSESLVKIQGICLPVITDDWSWVIVPLGRQSKWMAHTAFSVFHSLKILKTCKSLIAVYNLHQITMLPCHLNTCWQFSTTSHINQAYFILTLLTLFMLFSLNLMTLQNSYACEYTTKNIPSPINWFYP